MLKILRDKQGRGDSTAAPGFTIVELLIVIVVIAILTAVSIVSYQSIQAKARDSIRLQHAQQIAQALQMHKVTYGTMVESGSGCGAHGRGSGWFNRGGPHDPISLEGETLYTRSVLDCLLDKNLLSPDVIDPKNVSAFGASDAGGSGAFAYMKYNCDVNNSDEVYILFRLEAIPESDYMSPDSLCTSPALDLPYIYDQYGMNHWVKVAG